MFYDSAGHVAARKLRKVSMAKESKDGKFQFVFVNIEGDQSTLQEALRQVGTVLHQGIRPPAPEKTLIAVPVSKALPTSGNGTNDDQMDLYEVVPEQTSNSDIETVSVSSSRSPKPKREKKAGKVPELLKGFDPNDAEIPMAEFFSQHDTSSQFNKYLVIAAWFKRHYRKPTDEINASHIYTCYQLMKWQAPDNILQPFTDMKRLHSYFEKGSQGSWEISIVGINEVDRKRSSQTAAKEN